MENPEEKRQQKRPGYPPGSACRFSFAEDESSVIFEGNLRNISPDTAGIDADLDDALLYRLKQGKRHIRVLMPLKERSIDFPAKIIWFWTDMEQKKISAGTMITEIKEQDRVLLRESGRLQEKKENVDEKSS